jgi:1-acyl-sn-glycerol-3-phosphate acyltransferase
MNNIYSFGKLLILSTFKLFFRLKVFGRENFPRGGALVACNHASYLDPPIVGCVAPQDLYYLARESLFRKRFTNWLLRKVNGVPIKNSEADIASIKTVLGLLKAGKKIVLFPEGTRTLDGQFQKARRGIGYLVCKAKTPVIPTYIHGTFKVLPRNRKIPHFSKVIVEYGKPLYFDSIWSGTPSKEDYQRIGDVIIARIADIRAEMLKKL